MFDNPFTPIFGGKPNFFFGRKEVLARFDRALAVRGSEDRTLFVTGTRGCGKTALVEQLSQRAARAGWNTIDLTADNALQSFFRQIQEFDEVSSTTDPQLEVKVLGTGGSLGGKSKTRTSRYGVDDVDVLFRRACERAEKGFFVSVDEIQKVPLGHVSQICGAFQMASRKGCDVILAVAGLPYSFEPTIQHDGCTYLRRSVHEELGLFSPEETKGAFEEAFGSIAGLTTKDEALDALVRASSGHPYMIQLLGYHLIEYLNGSSPNKRHSVNKEDVGAVTQIALEAYQRRALDPLLSSASPNVRAYLQAMADLMDDAHVAATGDVARLVNKTHQQLTGVRQSLIDEGAIVAPERGKVRFAIPFLRDYLRQPSNASNNTALLETWDV